MRIGVRETGLEETMSSEGSPKYYSESEPPERARAKSELRLVRLQLFEPFFGKSERLRTVILHAYSPLQASFPPRPELLGPLASNVDLPATAAN
jgi:hypothetical protein